MKKHPLISILVAVVVLLLLVVLLVPLLVNANTFRPTLETQLSAALGRKVTLGNLSFSSSPGAWSPTTFPSLTILPSAPSHFSRPSRCTSGWK